MLLKSITELVVGQREDVTQGSGPDGFLTVFKLFKNQVIYRTISRLSHYRKNQQLEYKIIISNELHLYQLQEGIPPFTFNIFSIIIIFSACLLAIMETFYSVLVHQYFIGCEYFFCSAFLYCAFLNHSYAFPLFHTITLLVSKLLCFRLQSVPVQMWLKIVCAHDIM